MFDSSIPNRLKVAGGNISAFWGRSGSVLADVLGRASWGSRGIKFEANYGDREKRRRQSRSASSAATAGRAKCTMNLDEIVGEIIQGWGSRAVSWWLGWIIKRRGPNEDS